MRTSKRAPSRIDVHAAVEQCPKAAVRLVDAEVRDT
jgi:hypothetical protein